MGKGMLMPDSRSLEDCQVPVFKTHPTPVNVSVKPEPFATDNDQPSRSAGDPSGAPTNASEIAANSSSQGCQCTIL